MRTFRLTCLMTLICLVQSSAQDFDLAKILKIPDSLQKNANSITLFKNTEVIIHSQTKMTKKETLAVMVLNEEGQEDGEIVLFYDDHSKINSIKGKILGPFGNEIKKIREKDFNDVSAVDGGTLYSDDRLLYYEHLTHKYPYTILVEYETTSSNTAFIPTWYPLDGYYASTLENNFTISYPSDIELTTKDYHFDGYSIEKQQEEGKVRYSVKNAPAIKYEPLSPAYQNIAPHAKFALNKFSLAGVKGEASNWLEFGKWMYDDLLKGRDKISDQTKLEVQRLVAGIKDPKVKTRKIYDYMQEKTRYISVQIGIGGWKPMTAMEVDELKYGDCKALTNYTQSLLSYAGVPSYYTVLYANRRRDIDRDLASIQGNHAILMAPFEKDTVWLECTSSRAPFGHLGSFTDDRDVLVVMPDGGRILRTKKYSAEENQQTIKGSVQINDQGTMKADLTIASTGVQYDDHQPVKFLDKDDREKFYKGFFDEVNNVKMTSISLEDNEKEAIFKEKIAFNAENYSVNSGNRMLVRLNIVNTVNSIPRRARNRKLPMELEHGFIDVDEITIDLPTGYQIEAMAEPQILESQFGTYSIEIKQIDDKKLLYKRRLEIQRGIFSKDNYEAYRKFRKKINQLDNQKIVLIKANS